MGELVEEDLAAVVRVHARPLLRRVVDRDPPADEERHRRAELGSAALAGARSPGDEGAEVDAERERGGDTARDEHTDEARDDARDE